MPNRGLHWLAIVGSRMCKRHTSGARTGRNFFDAGSSFMIRLKSKSPAKCSMRITLQIFLSQKSSFRPGDPRVTVKKMKTERMLLVQLSAALGWQWRVAEHGLSSIGIRHDCTASRASGIACRSTEAHRNRSSDWDA